MFFFLSVLLLATFALSFMFAYDGERLAVAVHNTFWVFVFELVGLVIYVVIHFVIKYW
jgi:hypothetical protein